MVSQTYEDRGSPSILHSRSHKYQNCLFPCALNLVHACISSTSPDLKRAPGTHSDPSIPCQCQPAEDICQSCREATSQSREEDQAQLHMKKQPSSSAICFSNITDFSQSTRQTSKGLSGFKSSGKVGICQLFYHELFFWMHCIEDIKLNSYWVISQSPFCHFDMYSCWSTLNWANESAAKLRGRHVHKRSNQTNSSGFGIRTILIFIYLWEMCIQVQQGCELPCRFQPQIFQENF